MEKDVRESLVIIQQVLGLLNENLEEIDKRVTMLEVDDKGNDLYDYIKIPKNASNLDVLRQLFDARVSLWFETNDDTTALNLDGVTVFNTKWLKTKFKGGESIEAD